MSRQYAAIDPTRGGKSSAFVLALAMLASVAILVASVFLAIKLASEAGGPDDPIPPPPPPPPAVRVQISSALEMALLFMQAQKSGILPEDYPIAWRNNSGISDGQDQNRNLTGGFYDGGGNIKYAFPMAFSITMLSWSVMEYEAAYAQDGSLALAKDIINWGCQYLLQSFYKSLIFAQVGDPSLDDECFVRPEDNKPKMRPTALPCDVTHPCSDLAGEMAAALAASSMVYRLSAPIWASTLLDAAGQLFTFADDYRGVYSAWVDTARGEYNSTDYKDELMWAASWLFLATGNDDFMTYITVTNSAWSINQYISPGTSVFNWDNKAPGVQVLMSRLLLLGYGIANTKPPATLLQNFLVASKLYVCSYMPQTSTANFTTAGNFNGLLWQGTNDHPIQYAVNVGFLALLLSDYLKATTSAKESAYLNCAATFNDVPVFVQQQLDYILGKNPINLSYMIGYSNHYPARPYHMGSSIPNKDVDPTVYTCKTGQRWLETSDPNPNILVGALTGGPARDDSYADIRPLRNQSEPKLHVNAVFAGMMAGLRTGYRPGNSLTRMWVGLPFAARFAAKVQSTLPPASASPPPPPSTTPPVTSSTPLPPYTTPPPPSPPFKAPSPPPPNPPPDFNFPG